MSLVVAPCSRKAAEFAVLRWHYSKRMPMGKVASFGVWEREVFAGAVIFGRGVSPHLGKPYGLKPTECAELVRVALREHEAPVSQVVARAIRLLRASAPGLRLIASFADPEYGHHGGIYQAGNWIYAGTTDTHIEWIVNGRRMHDRVFIREARVRRRDETPLDYARRTDPHAKRIINARKYRYLYPLDRAMRRKITPLARPYPAAEVSMATHPASGEEGQVRPLQAAPSP